MKNEEIKDISLDIINLLLYENTILRKKLNKIKLTKKEEFFDTFIISPSVMINLITRNGDEKK
ncbi:MAG: hypothetical protein IJ704_05030 [Bacilli bacterium]|nr:hypothetical protein [Bacilli bacterium]